MRVCAKGKREWFPRGAGFQPGEKLTVRVSVTGQSKSAAIETLDYPAQPDGTFSIEDFLPLEEPNMIWEARVIHQRGVTCADIGAP